MKLTNKNLNNAIKRKFIKPLDNGCDYNISKLKVGEIKHKETINLLKQANETLKNVDYNLKKYNLVDANVLLRTSFEYVIMGMMIQFDEEIYDEFIILGVEREKTKICKIISEFRTHMNDICAEAYQHINRENKLKLLNELYDKMCNFTHATVIVSTMMEVESENEKKILQLLMYQNYYFLKMLLFECLKYFTSDKKHYIDFYNISFTYMFALWEIHSRISSSKLDWSKYNDLLYNEKNKEYFAKYNGVGDKIKIDLEELKKVAEENPGTLDEKLEEFLN